MGAVIVGPWDGAEAPVEHGDETADKWRRWAECFEMLPGHDSETVLLPRFAAEAMASYFRDREASRLEQLDRLGPMDTAQVRSRIQRLEAKAEIADCWRRDYWKLRDQVKRERKGTRLDTLDLDPKTRGHLWAADIVTVEELRKATSREEWFIKGIGPMRREEILDALNRDPEEG